MLFEQLRYFDWIMVESIMVNTQSEKVELLMLAR